MDTRVRPSFFPLETSEKLVFLDLTKIVAALFAGNAYHLVHVARNGDPSQGLSFAGGQFVFFTLIALAAQIWQRCLSSLDRPRPFFLRFTGIAIAVLVVYSLNFGFYSKVSETSEKKAQQFGEEMNSHTSETTVRLLSERIANEKVQLSKLENDVDRLIVKQKESQSQAVRNPLPTTQRP